MTKYLKIVEVVAIHHILIERYCGSHGIRDPGALDAALYRPASGYYDDIVSEAAALWESLTVNHPFVDGNKRTGFAVTDIFLSVNGYRITADSNEIWKFMNGLFRNNRFEFKHLEPWLRKNTEIIKE